MPAPTPSTPSRQNKGPDLLGTAWESYREFDYARVIERASDVIATQSAAEKGMAYLLRGASRYLLDDLKGARSDFAAAKKVGVVSLDAKIFSADMIEVFNKSK